MIQLATAPTEGRTGSPSTDEGKGSSSFESQRGRSGHAWPFLSRYAKPAARDGQKPTAGSSGS